MNNYLANNLTFMRGEKNITQQDIAELLDISRSSYVNYESGKYTPDINILIKICDFYSVSIDDIINADLSKSNYHTIEKTGEPNTLSLSPNQKILIPFVSRWNCLQYINLKNTGDLSPDTFPHFNFLGVNYKHAIALEVHNNDMLPSFTLGDVLLGLNHHKIQTHLLNKLLGLLLNNGDLEVGRLSKLEKNDSSLLLQFDNTNMKPRTVDAKSIISTCLIIGYLSFSVPAPIEPPKER